MIRVLLADDHALFRAGVKSLFDDAKNIKIIGEAEDGTSMVRKYFELKPDIVISDISMPNKSGPEAAKTILNKDPDAKILFLSQYIEDNYIYEVLKCNAFGLVGKNIIKDELVLAIKFVNKGKRYFTGKTEEELELLLSRFNNIKEKKGNYILDTLTRRENEVLMAIGEGISREKTAEKLKISIKTFDIHKYNIMAKLGIKTLPGIIKFAIELKAKNNEKETL